MLKMLLLSLVLMFLICCSAQRTSPQSDIRTRGPMGPCTWYERRNMNTQNGIGKSYDTVPACRDACLNSNNSCKYGFDWNPNHSRYKCWFSTSNVHAFILGISHHSITCPGTTVFMGSTMSGQSPGSNVCTWRERQGANTMRAIKMNANTLRQCQMKCLARNRCLYGLDYNSNAPPGERCWLATSSQLYISDSISHYTVTCRKVTTQDPDGNNKGRSLVSDLLILASTLVVATLLTRYG